MKRIVIFPLVVGSMLMLIFCAFQLAGCASSEVSNAETEPTYYWLYFLDADDGTVLKRTNFTHFSTTWTNSEQTLNWKDIDGNGHQVQIFREDYSRIGRYDPSIEDSHRRNLISGNYCLLISPKTLSVQDGKIMSQLTPKQDSISHTIRLTNSTGDLLQFEGNSIDWDRRGWNLNWHIYWKNENGEYFLRLPAGNRELEIIASNAGPYWN